MKSDDDRIAELESDIDMHRARMALKHDNGKIFCTPGECAQLQNAVNRAQNEVTAIENLKLQRLKKTKDDAPLLPDAELEAKSIEWLMARGYGVTKTKS